MSYREHTGHIIRRWILLCFCLCFSCLQSGHGKAVSKLHSVGGKRVARSIQEPGKIGCIHMASESGELWFQSPGGSIVCGLYLIGQTNQLVEVEFIDFDVTCQYGGLLATLDGWETQGQITPSNQDHALTMDERYKTYCGHNVPRTVFISSQNVALLQFRIPVIGEGFRVNIRFLHNHRPCNAVSLENEGVYTLKNYGEQRNCSVSFLYPEMFTALSLDVGESSLYGIHRSGETGTSVKCEARGRADFVEIRGGEGMDSARTGKALDICGMESNTDLPSVSIGCGHSVVRMVSSGNYYNTIDFRYSGLVDVTHPGVFKRCERE